MSSSGSHDRTGRPRATPWKARLALLAASLVLASGAAEVTLRLRDFDPHPAAKYRFHPRYGWTMDPAAWERVDEIRPSGFRTPTPGPEPATSPRLLLLGDSFTVAVEQPWRRTFAGRLAASVEARGGSLRTLSAGGWGTGQEYLALIHEGLAWRPDAVVLQVFPFNDLCNNGLALANTCSWQDHLRPYFVPDGDGLRQTWLQPVRGRLRSRLLLVGLADRFLWWRRMGSPGDSAAAFRRRTNQFTRSNARAIGLEHEGTTYSLVPAAAQPEPVRQAWAATDTLLAAIAGELAQRDIPLVAVVIPFSKTFGAAWTDYRRRRPRAMEPDHDTRRTEAALHRLGVPVVSMRTLIAAHDLDASQLFNRRNRHLSGEGHRWVAAWIEAELEGLAGFSSTAPVAGAPGR